MRCFDASRFDLDEPYIHKDLMRAGCQVFEEHWTEDVEKLLMRRTTDDFNQLSLEFCGNGEKEESYTRACYNLEKDIDVPNKLDNQDPLEKYPYNLSAKYFEVSPSADL